MTNHVFLANPMHDADLVSDEVSHSRQDAHVAVNVDANKLLNLVARVALRDQEALSQFQGLTHRRLEIYLLRILANRQEAEEAAGCLYTSVD